MRPVVRVENAMLAQWSDGVRLRAKLFDPHVASGAKRGEWISTTPVQSVNFAERIVVTANTVYVVDGNIEVRQ